MVQPLEKVIAILKESGICIVEDNAVTFLSLYLEGDPNNDEDEFLYISWTQEDGEMNTKFKRGNNKEVTVIGASLWLTDTEGDEIQLTPLFPKNLLLLC